MFGLAIFIHKLQNLAKMLLMISSLIFSITTQKNSRYDAKNSKYNAAIETT